MAIISKETFDKFKEEEKNELIRIYNEVSIDYLNIKKSKDIEKSEIFNKLIQLEIFFGKENLQPEPEIKTWKDVGNNKDNFCENYLNLYKTANGNYCLDVDKSHDIKVILKVIATIKIAKLIELGYGGTVTKEEWEDTGLPKFCIYVSDGKIHSNGFNIHDKHFITFHTCKQREEFLSYPENVELVKQYYMI